MAKCFSKFTRGSSVFHTSMRNKQVEFNPYIYTLSKMSRFGYEISVFKYRTGRYSEQLPEQPAHTSRMFLHGKIDVKICLMFTVAENTGSVNMYLYYTDCCFSLLHYTDCCFSLLYYTDSLFPLLYYIDSGFSLFILHRTFVCSICIISTFGLLLLYYLDVRFVLLVIRRLWFA